MAKITQRRNQSDSNRNLVSRDEESQEATIISNSIKNAITGDYPRVDNARPESFVPHLIPVAISPVSVNKIDRETSTSMLQVAQQIGFNVQHFELQMYGRSKQGRERLLSGSDVLANFGSLYGQANLPLEQRKSKLLETRSDLINFVKLIKDKAEKFSDPVKLDEWDDADRLTIQRTQYYGRFLQLPASSDLINLSYPRRFIDIINIVTKHYIERTEKMMPPRSTAMSLITDAVETSVGGPSFASAGINEFGYGYHEKRMITLFDGPVPRYDIDPVDYLDMAYKWGENLGLPDPSMTFASALSYRQGAKGHKPQKLWYHNGSEFVADYEGMSFESNQRLVYPASHFFNVILTPAVHQMKTFRKGKLGMYHTPELCTEYINRLNSQGQVSYESDFSSFDTTISNQIMKYIVSQLAFHSRKYSWEYQLFQHYLDTTGVIFPNFLTNETSYVTYFSGAVSLLSGILPTSEIGSIVSVCANLYALEKQLPNVLNDWLNNKFIILVQSDDVLFTLPAKIDEESFAASMKELSLTAKLKEGNMFLKKLLPVGTLQRYAGKFPVAGVPLWSRQGQQTFFNENDLDGKPECIMRLALLSRAEGLNKHPMYDKDLNDYWISVLSKFDMFKPVLNNLYSGVLSLSQEDKDNVIKYSSGLEGMAWLSKIASRAESDPKAKEMMLEMARLGFDLTKFEDTALSQRRAYLQALYTEPNTVSHENMLKILSWISV